MIEMALSLRVLGLTLAALRAAGLTGNGRWAGLAAINLPDLPELPVLYSVSAMKRVPAIGDE
jgi:hypothetical protein